MRMRLMVASLALATLTTVPVVAKTRSDRLSRSYVPGEVAALAGDAARAVAAGGQADDRMPPYLGVHFIIALEGIYPSRE